MSNFESNNEKIKFSWESPETEKVLLDLQNQIQLNQLKKDIAEFRIIGEFVSLGDSKDGKYSKYSYTVLSDLATPERIRYWAVLKGLANLKDKDGIQITDKKAQKYNNDYKFSSGDKVYVRIPKTKQSEKTKQPEKNKQPEKKGKI